MIKKHVLPMSNPDFICYPHATYSNAIIKANFAENISSVFCSKYINCYFKQTAEENKFVISIFDYWCTQQKLLQYQTIKLSSNAFSQIGLNLMKTIKKCLCFNTYILCTCNGTYLNSEHSFFPFQTDAIITGFNDIKQHFVIYAIDNLGNFLCRHINYNTFINSLIDNKKPIIILDMWKCSHEKSNYPDFPNTIFELSDYINSTNNRNHYTADKTYGIAAFQELASYFCETSRKGEELSPLYLQKFLMHKYYMNERMIFLSRQNIIEQKWPITSESIYKLAQSAYDLGMRYNATYNGILAIEMVTIMNNIINIEKDYLHKVLNQLKRIC